MSDLHPGVTRYRLQGYRYRRQGPGAFVVSAALLVGVVALAIWVFDSDPATALTIAAVCAVVPASTIVLPWLLRAIVIVGAGIGVLSWANTQGHFGPGYALCWLAGTIAGMTPLMALAYRRYRRQRLDRAEGAPPSGLDPSDGTDVGVLATWRDAEFDYEAAAPPLEVVLDAVRALNGEDRTFVSIFNGRGRMDVGGDARRQLVVLQSDDRRTWHMVESPHESSAEQPVVVAGVRTRYPGRRMTTLSAAERAVTAWLQRGERHPDLDWWDDSALDEPFRPRPLTLND
jgi:hypothetical protein